MSPPLAELVRSLPAIAGRHLPFAVQRYAPFTTFKYATATIGQYAPTALLQNLPVAPMYGRGLLEVVRGVMISGAAVTVPFLVTVAVLGFVVNFVSNVLDPFVQVLTIVGLTAGQDRVVAEGITLLLLFAVVFVAGVVSETSSDSRVGPAVQGAVKEIPGVGSVYGSFDRMSEVLLESDSESFQEVKLLEFPHAGIHSLAFVTAELPEGVGTDEDMQVLFVPLAPNPVMGGFMVCVPKEQVQDVDMTVQEAFQALVTSGVAMPSEE